MKSYGLALLAGAALLAGCTGGGDVTQGSSPSTPERAGISENDLVQEPGLEVNLTQTAVLDTREGGLDTGTSGVDVIPYHLEAGDFALALEEDAVQVQSAVLRDAAGNELLRVDPGTPEASANLSGGDYLLEVASSLPAAEASAVLFLGVEPAVQGRESAAAVTADRRLAIRAAAGTGTNLRGVDLVGRDLTFAKFGGANMAGADMTGVTGAAFTNFRQANLTGALMGPQSIFNSSEFHGAVLDRAYMADSEFIGAVFDGAILDRATMLRSNFTFAQMRDTSLVEVITFRTIFSQLEGPRADFTRARLELADFGAAQLPGADFTGAVIPGADFGGANLSGAIAPNGRTCPGGAGEECFQ